MIPNSMLKGISVLSLMINFLLHDGCSYAIRHTFSRQTYTVALQIIDHRAQSNTTISFDSISNFKTVYQVLILQNTESKYLSIPILKYTHSSYSSHCKQYSPASGVDDEEIPHRLWSLISALERPLP